MKKRAFSVAVGLLALAPPFLAHDVITTNLTFSRDVSRIFASHCLPCHGSGTNIPLATYQETRPWAVSIKEQVLSRAMPPWGAVKGFGNLFPDNSLTQEDIMIIAAWVVGGAPEGNPAHLPEPSLVVPAPPPTLSDQLEVRTRAKLVKAIEADGIKPLESRTVASAKVMAQLPDGELVPLLWLYRFDGRSNRSFSFRSTVKLPAGTVVESSSPLRFALQSRTGSDSFKVTRPER